MEDLELLRGGKGYPGGVAGWAEYQDLAKKDKSLLPCDFCGEQEKMRPTRAGRAGHDLPRCVDFILGLGGQ